MSTSSDADVSGIRHLPRHAEGMTGAKPTRKCLSTETKTGLPCQEDVDVTRARREHGHVCTTTPRASFVVAPDLDA